MPAHVKKNMKEALLFLFRMGIFSGVLYLILFSAEGLLQGIESEIAQRILQMLGTHVYAGHVAHVFVAEGFLIEISSLCSGLLEICLLAGAILATHEYALHARVQGVIIFCAILFAANIVRIVASVQQLVYTSLSFAEFTHGILFRGVLILGFALLYAAWLRTAQKSE